MAVMVFTLLFLLLRIATAADKISPKRLRKDERKVLDIPPKEFRSFLESLDKRPAALRIADLVGPSAPPWERGEDFDWADELLLHSQVDLGEEKIGERAKLKHAVKVVRGEEVREEPIRELPVRQEESKNELKPKSILRKDRGPPRSVSFDEGSLPKFKDSRGRRHTDEF